MPAPLRVAITGATGLVGTALQRELRAAGHTPVPLVRRAPGSGEVRWDPAGRWDPTPLEGIDAVVHLAGAGIADRRWTRARKEEIERSRVDGTRSLVQGLATLESPPKVLVSASAVGFYGDRGATLLEEASASGTDWLAGVARAWEGEAGAAKRIRVVRARFGIILTPDGGALGKMLLPFKLGVGGRLGSGEQWMSWIAIGDLTRAILFAITDPRVEGAVNFTAPAPVTNAEFTRVLGSVLGRPTPFPAPGFALRLALGEMADGALLASQRVLPTKLQSLGFQWTTPELGGALRSLLSR